MRNGGFFVEDIKLLDCYFFGGDGGMMVLDFFLLIFFSPVLRQWGEFWAVNKNMKRFAIALPSLLYKRTNGKRINIKGAFLYLLCWWCGTGNVDVKGSSYKKLYNSWLAYIFTRLGRCLFHYIFFTTAKRRNNSDDAIGLPDVRANREPF